MTPYRISLDISVLPKSNRKNKKKYNKHLILIRLQNEQPPLTFSTQINGHKEDHDIWHWKSRLLLY